MKYLMLCLAAGLILGPTAAHAQGTTGSTGTGTSSVSSTVPGAAPNGMIGGGASQSLQETNPPTGPGYDPTIPGLGISPSSPTFNSNGTIPPASGTTGSAAGSSGAPSGG